MFYIQIFPRDIRDTVDSSRPRRTSCSKNPHRLLIFYNACKLTRSYLAGGSDQKSHFTSARDRTCTCTPLRTLPPQGSLYTKFRHPGIFLSRVAIPRLKTLAYYIQHFDYLQTLPG